MSKNFSRVWSVPSQESMCQFLVTLSSFILEKSAGAGKFFRWSFTQTLDMNLIDESEVNRTIEERINSFLRNVSDVQLKSGEHSR